MKKASNSSSWFFASSAGLGTILAAILLPEWRMSLVAFVPCCLAVAWGFRSRDGNTMYRRLLNTLCQFLPMIWPRGNLRLQAYLYTCLVMLVTGRILNLYVPWLNKSVVDSLTMTSSPFRYDLILLTITLSLIHRLMDTLHGVLWSNLEQHTTLTLQTRFFSHLHSLPHSYHTRNKTSDLFSVAELGSEALNNILEHIAFSITPAIADILITILYLSTIFNPWIGFIVIVQVLLYLAVTMYLMEWKKCLHRPMNAAARAKHQYAMDSLLNFETVKYFTNEEYECEQMKERIANFHTAEFQVNLAGKMIDLGQVLVMSGGLLFTSLVCGWLVWSEECSVGDYFLFFSHFGQLHGLLKYFGGYYRSISRSLVNMESLVGILNEEPETGGRVQHEICLTSPSPKAEIVGHIEFRNVSFGYGDNKTLNDVSFTVAAGKSLAIVGPSGSGKSTLLKLLFRFYDPSSGQILLDGRDVRDYPLQELRCALGIVPQDTILFNDTLRKNIRYGKIGATPAELKAAAKYACIHDKCVSLPLKYDTEVGERGACLSGGEKLRVTLARMFLKQAQVYLLDEATAALDSMTERSVMGRIKELARGKTMVIVTHKLMMASEMDRIIVIVGGCVVESGNHSTLSKGSGVYARMWRQQQVQSG